jgi:hypothetical protein
VQELLANPQRLQQIAANGFKKAGSGHLWADRAEQFLKINEEHRT